MQEEFLDYQKQPLQWIFNHGKLLVCGYVHEQERKNDLSRHVSQEIYYLISSFCVGNSNPFAISDLAMLYEWSVKMYVEHLQNRYTKMDSKCIYTVISPLNLICINPYEQLQIYDQDTIDEFYRYQTNKYFPLHRPHPYGVAAQTYLKMMQNRCNQSIIISGEVGSGKTETSKLLMRYLTSTNETIITKQINAISPILEAFGNAKCVLNANASLFTIFTKLLYDNKNITGCSIQTYLFDKSRVVFQAKNERNYHIPYILYHGIPKDKHNTFSIIDTQKCWYTNQGGESGINDIISDKQRYEELIKALTTMNIDQNMQNKLWNIISGIVNLGNMSFKREGDGFASINSKAELYLNNICKTWGIDMKMIINRLLTCSIKVCNQTISQKLPYSWDDGDVHTNRDLIAKCLYQNLFSYLCNYINNQLLNDTGNNDYDEKEDKIYPHESAAVSTSFICILEVFAFQNVWINSLEQFCMNYLNEKIQQFYNYHIVFGQQKEYFSQSIMDWKPFNIPENREYLEMMEDSKSSSLKNGSFFDLLNSTCKAPKPSVEEFMQRLFRRNQSRQCLRKATQPGAGNARGPPRKRRRKVRRRYRFDGFTVLHYADNVTYDVSKFLIKNMEILDDDTIKMCTQSSNDLLRSIGENLSKKIKISNHRKTVTTVFNDYIKILIKTLQQTEPYFIKCINPNMDKSCEIWTDCIVEYQLRCHGITEVARVFKLAYPVHVSYDKLRYKCDYNFRSNLLMRNMNSETLIHALLIAFDINENYYKLGLTKIYFKSYQAYLLDEVLARSKNSLTKEQISKIKQWLIQKRICQLVGACKAILKLRKRVRVRQSGHLSGP